MPFLLPSHPCSVPQCPTAAVPDPPWAGCSPLGSRGRPRGCSYHGADAVGGGGADGVVVGVCSCVHSAIARSKQRWVLVPTAGLLSPLRALPPSHTWEPPGTSLLPLSRGPCWQDTLPMPDPVLPTALRAGGVTVGSAGAARRAGGVTVGSAGAARRAGGVTVGSAGVAQSPPRCDAHCLPVTVCGCCCCGLGVPVGSIAPLQEETLVRGLHPLGGWGWGHLGAPWHCRVVWELVPVPLGTHQPHYHSPGAFTNINLKKLNFQRRDCHLPARFNEVSR